MATWEEGLQQTRGACEVWKKEAAIGKICWWELKSWEQKSGKQKSGHQKFPRDQKYAMEQKYVWELKSLEQKSGNKSPGTKVREQKSREQKSREQKSFWEIGSNANNFFRKESKVERF